MATNYPSSLDTSTQQPSPTASTEMDDAGFLHDEVHTNASGAIIALETKLGVGATTAATASTNHVLVKQADGDTEWAAAPSSTPTVITVADTTDTTCSVALFEDATGDLAPKTDGGATYNAGTGVLTATGFAGPLTGNVTGNASGSAGSCTGNSATATNSTTVTVADTTDTSCSVALFESATGSLGAKTDGGVTYNAGTGTLTATAFAGALTGNVTGNASGTAATVTGAAQSAITSVGALTGLTIGSDGNGGDVTFHSDTAGDALVWDSSAESLTITGTNAQTALAVADGNVTMADDLTVTGGIVGGSVVAPIAFNNQTGTTYTFVIGDAGKLVTSSNGSAQTFTVPPNSSVAYAIGTQIIVQNIGSANCTLAQGSGVTITSVDSSKEIDGQYASACLIKTASDAWTLIGKLA